MFILSGTMLAVMDLISHRIRILHKAGLWLGPCTGQNTGKVGTKILGPVGIPLMVCRSHQAINLVQQDGKSPKERPSEAKSMSISATRHEYLVTSRHRNGSKIPDSEFVNLSTVPRLVEICLDFISIKIRSTNRYVRTDTDDMLFDKCNILM